METIKLLILSVMLLAFSNRGMTQSIEYVDLGDILFRCNK